MNRKRIRRNNPYKPVKTPYGYTKTREEVLGAISEFYTRYQYSKEILKIKVNQDKYLTNIRQPNNSQYVENIYERYGLLYNKELHRPMTQQEYGDYLRKNSPYNDEQITMLYKDYDHIKGLVITGQYEEYRVNEFRKNYINAMKDSGLPKYAIDNLEKLSYEQFKLLAEQREPNKSKTNKWRLPELGGFDYRNAGTVDKQLYSNSAVKEIKELFEELRMKWDEPEIVEYSFKPRKYNKRASRSIQRLIRFVPKENRPGEKYMKPDVPIGDLLNRTVQTLPRDRIKRSKSGEYYIPFIGSTRKGTKNRNLLRDIIDLLGLEYE